MTSTEQSAPAGHLFAAIPREARGGLSALERIILYVGVFLVPFANLRFSAVFFTLSDLFFCLSLILLVVTGRMPRRPLEAATPLWLLAFILLFVGLMVGSLLRGSPERGLIVTAQYLFSYLILMVILIRKDPVEVHRIAAIFVAGMLLIDVHGIYTFYTVGYVPGEGKGVVTGAQRLATVLRNPNLAASMNALTMPILLYFWASGRLKTYIALPLAAIIVFTVILTSSNSGLIMITICFVVFSTLIISARLMMRIFFALSIAVFAFLSVGGTDYLPKTFHKRVLAALTTGDASEAGTFISRTALMKEAIEVISQDRIVLVGLGADQFRERSVQEAPVHNLYLLLWVEGGLLAVAGWILFSGVGILIFFAIRKAGRDRYAAAAVATTVAVFLAIAIFNPHMYARYWTVPVLLSFGIGLAHLRSPSRPREQR